MADVGISFSPIEFNARVIMKEVRQDFLFRISSVVPRQTTWEGSSRNALIGAILSLNLQHISFLEVWGC